MFLLLYYATIAAKTYNNDANFCNRLQFKQQQYWYLQICLMLFALSMGKITSLQKK